MVVTDPRAGGEALFRAQPDLMLVEVHRAAWDALGTYDGVPEFVEAYVNARKRKWEYEREQRS